MYAVSVDESRRRVSVQVVAGDRGRLAELTQGYDAGDLCFGPYHPPQPPGPEGPVLPLAKIDELQPSRREREAEWTRFALAEIAFDAATAKRVWAEHLGPVCTDDGDRYRMLLAVDRDRLPEPSDLPLDTVEGVPDARRFLPEQLARARSAYLAASSASTFWAPGSVMRRAMWR